MRAARSPASTLNAAHHRWPARCDGGEVGTASGTVSLLDARGGALLRTVHTGGAPDDLLPVVAVDERTMSQCSMPARALCCAPWAGSRPVGRTSRWTRPAGAPSWPTSSAAL